MQQRVSDEVLEALTERFGTLAHIGTGAWSTAFEFTRGGEQLVLRVGEHVADFQVDAEMADYASAALPIPAVTELEQLEAPHDHMFICVSTYATGKPLELCSPGTWPTLVPAVADLLETMRGIPAPAGTHSSTWSRSLLHVPSNEGRLAGWRDRLDRMPIQRNAYEQALGALRRLVQLPRVARVAPTLLHCDLINRNVHVDESAITGVFDWGCRRWGDHLYDLAWFRFWDPWMDHLDAELLERELVGRWGAEPDPDRYAACLLHIGADHIVYNAATGDPADGLALVERLSTLGLL